jgi:hypothetical protein
MDFSKLSTTSVVKEMDIVDLYNYVQVPNPYKVLPSIRDILDLIADLHSNLGLSYSMKVYYSNASVGDMNLDNKIVIIPKFQLEVVYNDIDVVKGSSILGSVYTFYYNNLKSIEYSIAFIEKVLVCSNGSYTSSNILNVRNRFSDINLLRDMLLLYYSDRSINIYLGNLLKSRELLSKGISLDEELRILGDMLRKAHTKEHILDISIISEASRYALDSNNPFKRGDNGRSVYDFMQDFTYAMKGTEISTHIVKNRNLVQYFEKYARCSMLNDQ